MHPSTLAIIAILPAVSLVVLLAQATISAAPPRRMCEICAHKTARHPAGPLRRYTRRRVHGQPVCRRHDHVEAAEIMTEVDQHR
jgi:hypothetical protein